MGQESDESSIEFEEFETDLRELVLDGIISKREKAETLREGAKEWLENKETNTTTVTFDGIPFEKELYGLCNLGYIESAEINNLNVKSSNILFWLF